MYVLLDAGVVALRVDPVAEMSDDVCVSMTFVFCILKSDDDQVDCFIQVMLCFLKMFDSF